MGLADHDRMTKLLLATTVTLTLLPSLVAASGRSEISSMF